MEHLLERLADIERQLEDDTLSHSDQQLLCRFWEELHAEMEILQLADEYDDQTIESEAESIHTQPKRPRSPLPLHPSLLIDIGNGCFLTPDEFDELHTLMFVDDEEGMYEPAN